MTNIAGKEAVPWLERLFVDPEGDMVGLFRRLPNLQCRRPGHAHLFGQAHTMCCGCGWAKAPSIGERHGVHHSFPPRIPIDHQLRAQTTDVARGRTEEVAAWCSQVRTSATVKSWRTRSVAGAINMRRRRTLYVRHTGPAQLAVAG